VLWLTGCCQIGDVTNPNYAPVLGVARVLRNDVQLDFGTLELDNFEAATNAVPDVLAQCQRRVSETSIDPEYEWAHVEGRTFISGYTYIKVAQEQEIVPSSDAIVRRLGQHKPGAMNSLYRKALAAPTLQDEEIRIEVKVTGMNSEVREF